MKVILLTDIPRVGNRYDVKDFKEGYAQNVLISRGLAILATPTELAKLAEKKSKLEKIKNEEEETFALLISGISGASIKIFAKANEKGHLFKAISPADVREALRDGLKIEIDEGSIIVPHIKELGTHKVTIKKGSQMGECQIVVEALK